jgi:hypothetical protein
MAVGSRFVPTRKFQDHTHPTSSKESWWGYCPLADGHAKRVVRPLPQAVFSPCCFRKANQLKHANIRSAKHFACSKQSDTISLCTQPNFHDNEHNQQCIQWNLPETTSYGHVVGYWTRFTYSAYSGTCQRPLPTAMWWDIGPGSHVCIQWNLPETTSYVYPGNIGGFNPATTKIFGAKACRIVVEVTTMHY